MLTRLQKFLNPLNAKLNSQVIFWLSLSLVFAFFYGLLGLKIAFSSEYVVQDDARQHVFWMRRFLDPELFPNDLLADYFQSVAPLGYSTFYRVFASVGIDPMVLNKFIPIGLGLVTTVFSFGVCLQIFPVPIAGFLGTLLLNQYLWLRDDLVSATAVAFVYPLFTAFLYYLLRRQLVGVCIAIALLGLFYPQCVFIGAGILILQLVQWRNKRITVSQNRRDYIFCLTGLTVSLIVLSLYALKSSQYGPVITAAEARTLPEFRSTGLSQFFVELPQHYWFTGQRSGIMPKYGTVLPIVATVVLVMLPFSKIFPLVKQLTSQSWLLVQITLASLAMFFAAHALLFRLHLPTRYTEHSLRIVTAIAGGIAFTILLDACLYWAESRKQNYRQRQQLALGFTFLLLTAIVIYPFFLEKFPRTDYAIGRVPVLYQFFAQQPKDILIASLSEETVNLPSFTQRSILVGGAGFPVPYHQGYYAQIRQRTNDLIAAQYSPELQQVQNFIQKYGVDFWLVERDAWQPIYIAQSRWIRQYKTSADQAINRLHRGQAPALMQVMDRCTALATGNFVVLEASCITKESPLGG